MNRRMAVNDKAFERLFAAEKLLTNPEQIFFLLLSNGNAGSNAGMYKQEIPAAEREIERFQKLKMLPGDGSCQFFSELCLFGSVRIYRRLEPV